MYIRGASVNSTQRKWLFSIKSAYYIVLRVNDGLNLANLYKKPVNIFTMYSY